MSSNFGVEALAMPGASAPREAEVVVEFESHGRPRTHQISGFGCHPYSCQADHIHLPVLSGGFMPLVMLLLICVTFILSPSFAQTKHAFTFEDMMSLKRIGEPVPSPDGKWVAFSAVSVDLNANTRTPHVWIVPLAGGDARQIIKDQDADRPRWAPDGRRFLFLSKKEGGSQVWIAGFDTATGTVTGVHKLTAVATEAAGPIWSPDGKSIAFTSDVYPDCPDQACNAQKLAAAEKSPVKALIFTRLLHRHWNAYKEGKRTHILWIPADGGAVRDLTPGDYDSPVFSLGGQDNYAFSPDGHELCYTSNHDQVEAISTNNDLWIVPVSGGAAKNITANNPASDSTPLYSPDGHYIAYRAQQRPGYESDRFRLMLYDRRTAQKKNLTEDFDRWVGSYVWSPDSKTIYFAAEHKRHSLIYAVGSEPTPGTANTRSSNAPRAIVGGFNDDLAVTPDGMTLVFTRMSISAPNEVYAASTEGEGCPVKPPNFDINKKYPVKFLIHGGPQGAWGDDWSYRWNPQLFAANGYVVIMINFH